VHPGRHPPRELEDGKRDRHPEARKSRLPPGTSPRGHCLLLDSLGKLVEKTAAHLIADQLERNRSLHEGQQGCRRRRSCVDAVAVLASDAERAWSQKRIAGALLMDVKSAFNNASRGHLVGRLVERWLGIWLNPQLTLKEHHEVRMKKARNAQNRLRRLAGQVGLSPENCRRVQSACVQAAALFGSELWWKGDNVHGMVGCRENV